MWYECLSSTELEKLKSVRIKNFRSRSSLLSNFYHPSHPTIFFVKCSPSIPKECLIEVCSLGGNRKVLYLIVPSWDNEKGAFSKCALPVESERSCWRFLLLKESEMSFLKLYYFRRIRNASLCVYKKQNQALFQGILSLQDHRVLFQGVLYRQSQKGPLFFLRNLSLSCCLFTCRWPKES